MDRNQKPFRPLRKPEWLKIQRGSIGSYTHTAASIEEGGLHTICSGGNCPNRAECWSRGTATFMIGGAVCTRACRFCATPSSAHPAPPDPEEPVRVAEAVKEMRLRYVVLTSVDRDDLPDYGANHWCSTIAAIRELCPNVVIEALVPDFNGDKKCLEQICSIHPEVVAHNLETVRRLTPEIRHRAKYDRSLEVLRYLSDHGMVTKTGIMVGLGETPEEVEELMRDAVNAGVSTLTIGQYLQPTRHHANVIEYVTPEQFAMYKVRGEALGLVHVESGPLVRSSYLADRQFEKAHKQLKDL